MILSWKRAVRRNCHIDFNGRAFAAREARYLESTMNQAPAEDYVPAACFAPAANPGEQARATPGSFTILVIGAEVVTAGSGGAPCEHRE